jgi:hypothetical protein
MSESFNIIIILLTLIITLGAQAYINFTYDRTKKIQSNSRKRGFEVARKILDSNGLKNVQVVETSGVLSDHYDPKSKCVRLSPEVYASSSIASISVAAHECGHAIQDKDGYFFLRFRSSIVPIVNFASHAGYIAILIGLFTQATNFLWIGIFLEFIILFFQLITLPVEFNASKRALYQIEDLGIVGKSEKKECFKMLRAAALTYVASVATAILEILRLILIARQDDR